MQTQSADLPAPAARSRLAAMTLGLFSAAYAGLGAWYLYHDFFKYLGRNMPTAVDGSGFAVQVNCYLWTVLSPWRVGMLVVTVALLGVAGLRLLRDRPGARALSLFTLWGVLLPQALWFTEFAVDWNGGHGVNLILVAALALVAVPTMLLFEGADTLGQWCRGRSSHRLLLTAIASGWVAFGATEFLDHSYQLDSSLAYWGATSAAILGGLAAFGLLRLRTWGLLAAVSAAACLAVVPLAFLWTRYLPSGGYIDGFVMATSGCGIKAAVSAAVPLALVGFLAAPFLRSFARRLRD